MEYIYYCERFNTLYINDVLYAGVPCFEGCEISIATYIGVL